jgi:hypothetical protein
VSEWLKELAWKASIWVTVSRVRIPSSLQNKLVKEKVTAKVAFFCIFNPQNSGMRIFFAIIFFLSGFVVLAQTTTTVETPFTKVDSLYREDQFYVGVTYDLLRHTPAHFMQNSFSIGLSAGFLRDMPINKKRTLAIAAGFGFSYDKYHQNLVVSEADGTKHYEIVDKNSFSNNKMEQVFIDVPVEFRWRNSTPESYKFWRIYTGFKLRYQVFDKTKYVGNTTETVFHNSDFNSLHYGPYLAVGHNTINLYVYYGMNPIFKSAKIDGKSIDMQTLNFGLMFYIL